MKPLVSAFKAWSCIVISLFAIVILSVIGSLFKSGSSSFLGSEEDPEDGEAAASAIFGAVFVYIGFLVFCASQAWMHARQSAKGDIRLS